jgi:hypothetical protein
MFIKGSKASEKLSKLVILNGTATELQICTVAVNMFSEFQIDIWKLVSVTTNGISSTLSKEVGCVILPKKHVCYLIVFFIALFTEKHCVLNSAQSHGSYNENCH